MGKKKPTAPAPAARRTSFAFNEEDAARLERLLVNEQKRSPTRAINQTDIMRQALYEMSKKRQLEPAASASKAAR